MTTNFYTKPGASLEEITAVFEEGLDAMYEAHDAGREDTSVAFLIAADDKIHNEDNDNVSTIKEDVSVCQECEEDPCLFVQNKISLVAFDEAEHADLATEDVPSNNVIRKKLYRQLTLMINGGPLGAGVRRELPKCCVSAVREMHPSDTFMGFKAE